MQPTWSIKIQTYIITILKEYLRKAYSTLYLYKKKKYPIEYIVITYALQLAEKLLASLTNIHPFTTPKKV